jgi:tetratricopeptide (TPR) repeat protein
MSVANLFLLRAAVVGLGLVLPAAAGAAASDAAHYRRCMADSSANPTAALADAEGWSRAGGGVPAEHCAGSALFNLKRYADAGKRLDRAAASPAKLDAEFRVALFNQAGNAWLVAGDGARAIQSFSGALALSPGEADLFADLARAHAMRRNWHEVVLDLNAALQLSPRRPDLLVLRASARRALKSYHEAHLDLEAALKIKPDDGNALVERGLLRRQLGDIGGARRDFQAALKTATGAVAADAKANLEDLSP